MADGFIGKLPANWFTGAHPDDRFVIPRPLNQPARKFTREDLDRLPKINGYIGEDMAKGGDTTAISITKGGFIQSVIYVTRLDYAMPRTGDVMQMIADIDKIEQTPASRYEHAETKLRSEISKSISKAMGDNFFRVMSGLHGSKCT